MIEVFLIPVLVLILVLGLVLLSGVIGRLSGLIQVLGRLSVLVLALAQFPCFFLVSPRFKIELAVIVALIGFFIQSFYILKKLLSL